MVDSIKLFNKSTSQSILLDKFSAGFLLDDEGIDWGTVTPTITSYPSIYGLGSEVSNITFQKEREIVITGWVINDNTGTIEQKKRILNNFVNPLNEVRLYAMKYYIDGYPKTSVKYTNKRKENNDIVCKFQITLTCVDPFFRLIEPISHKEIKPNFDGTWKGWSIELNNTSGFSYGIELYLKLDDEVTINTFTVINATTQRIFKLKYGNTYTGTILYLDTIKGKFSFGEVESIPTTSTPEEFNKLDMSDSNFEFIQLVPGLNVINVSCGLNVELGNSKLDIYFNPVFLNFEEM